METFYEASTNKHYERDIHIHIKEMHASTWEKLNWRKKKRRLNNVKKLSKKREEELRIWEE
jgi:hypothetical protein